jgi:hypothetical protein
MDDEITNYAHKFNGTGPRLDLLPDRTNEPESDISKFMSSAGQSLAKIPGDIAEFAEDAYDTTVDAAKATYGWMNENALDFAPFKGMTDASKEAEKRWGEGDYFGAAASGVESVASGALDAATLGTASVAKAAATKGIAAFAAAGMLSGEKGAMRAMAKGDSGLKQIGTLGTAMREHKAAEAAQKAALAANKKRKPMIIDGKTYDQYGHGGAALADEAMLRSERKIWKETGWAKDPVSGDWKFEINDQAAKITDFGTEKMNKGADTLDMARLGDVIQHDELFKVYPELKDTMVMFEWKPGSGYAGTVTNNGTVMKLNLASFKQYDEQIQRIMGDDFAEFNTRDSNRNKLETLLHEIQHLVQTKEGHTLGTNPGAFKVEQKHFKVWDADTETLQDAHILRELAMNRNNGKEPTKDIDMNFVKDYFEDMFGWTPSEQSIKLANTRQISYKSMGEEIATRNRYKKFTADPDESYYGNVGEADARLTEGRVRLSDESRARNYIYDTADDTPNSRTGGNPEDREFHTARSMRDVPTSSGMYDIKKPVAGAAGAAVVGGSMMTNASEAKASTRESNTQDFSKLWGWAYQGKNDPEKMKKFRADVKRLYGKAPKEKELRKMSRIAADAFAGDAGMDPKQFEELMYMTALHESGGGRYKVQQVKFRKPKIPKKGVFRKGTIDTGVVKLSLNEKSHVGFSEGPARGYWQVEPQTAKNMLEHAGKLFGNKFTKYTGLKQSELKEMNIRQLERILMDPKVNTMFAAAKYAQAIQARKKNS